MKQNKYDELTAADVAKITGIEKNSVPDCHIQDNRVT